MVLWSCDCSQFTWPVHWRGRGPTDTALAGQGWHQGGTPGWPGSWLRGLLARPGRAKETERQQSRASQHLNVMNRDRQKCQNLPLSILGSWRESAQNLKLFSTQMCIHNEGSLVDVARSESSGLSWTLSKRVKESRTRSGEATSYIYWSWSSAKKIPLISGDSDSEPGWGAFSDTWS